jgi:hypothetical protein
MLISKILRRTLLFLAAIPASSVGQSALVKGTYDANCESYTFRLPEPRAATSESELRLMLHWRGGLYPPAFESAGWIDVQAKRCSKSDQCEEATKGQIRFERIGKRITGGFRIEFANDREEGKFKVKYHHTGPRMICE